MGGGGVRFCVFLKTKGTNNFFDILEMEEVEPVAVEHHDLIDITEEADLIQSERIIDDSDPREARHGRKNKDDVRLLEEMMLVMNVDNDEIQQERDAEWEVNS